MAEENKEYAEDEDPLILDEDHANKTHDRWIKRKNRLWPSREEDIPDHWYNEQCGQCRFYLLLQGRLSTDWGVCSNAASPFDGTVLFEHDGCDQYVGANAWVSTYPYLRENPPV